MAMTIKELSKKYLRSKRQWHYEGYDIEDAVEYGAKAVLEQVENIVYRRYSDDGDPDQRNKDLIKLIQQLKG